VKTQETPVLAALFRDKAVKTPVDSEVLLPRARRSPALTGERILLIAPACNQLA
jgi:hypothetical protein